MCQTGRAAVFCVDAGVIIGVCWAGGIESRYEGQEARCKLKAKANSGAKGQGKGGKQGLRARNEALATAVPGVGWLDCRWLCLLAMSDLVTYQLNDVKK